MKLLAGIALFLLCALAGEGKSRRLSHREQTLRRLHELVREIGEKQLATLVSFRESALSCPPSPERELLLQLVCGQEVSVPLLTAEERDGLAAYARAESRSSADLRTERDALLALSAGVLRAADLTGDGVLTSFSKLLFTVSRWGVRIISAGYSILAALMGAGAAGMDSLLLRTGRMAAGSLPLVGSLVSDSLGATAVCLSLVKGALGRTGMLLIIWQAAGPALALLLQGFGLRAASSLLVPLEQREMATMLSALGKMLTILGALILAAGAMLGVSVGGAAGCFGGL